MIDKTVANFLYSFAAVFLVRFVGGITTFVIARILSPADYGMWVTLLVIGSYAPIICLGTLEALVKMFPFYTGRGEAAKAALLESNVLGSLVLAAGLLLTAGATFHFFVQASDLGSLVNIIRLFVLAASLALLSAFYYYRFTAHQNFRYVSYIEALRAVTLFLLIVPFSWLWGLMGAALAFTFNEILILTFSHAANNRILGKLAVSFDLREIKGLVATGFPITVIWWTYMLQTSVDRLISMSMLGKAPTGYYGLGASMASAIVLIPMILGRVLYPKVNEEVGKNAGRARLTNYVLVPAQGLGLFLPLVIGTLIILTPELYRVFFPKYVRGIASAQILLLGVYFVSLIRTGVNYLVAINKQNNVLLFVLASLCANVLTSVVLVKQGYSIEGISVGTSVSALVFAALLWRSVFGRLGYAPAAQGRELAFLLMPFLLCVTLSLGLPALVREAIPGNAPLASGCAAVLFAALYALGVTTIPPLNAWSKSLASTIREQARAAISRKTSA
jgi:O-antigen/teichoic acid export membrane protein